MIYLWARQHGLNEDDSSDLVQDVLASLVISLPKFTYDPSRRFRGWLRTVTLNQARVWFRKQKKLDVTQLETVMDPTIAAGTDLFEESEYRSFLVARCKELIERDFEPTTWQCCWKYVSEDRTAADVANEMGVSENAVRVAKCRVLKQLRQELSGLLN